MSNKIRIVMRIQIIIPVILLFSSLNVTASFEDVEIGAKAASLAGSFVSYPDDSSAVFYNPSGLVLLKSAQIMASYEKMFWGLTDESNIAKQIFCAGLPLKFGSFGISWNQLSLDSLYSESTIKFAFAREIIDDLNMGVGLSSLSVKYGSTEYTDINSVFEKANTKTAASFDAGLIYNKKLYSLGLSVININAPDVGIKYENLAERRIAVGASFKRQIIDLSLTAVFEGDRYKFKTGIQTWLYRRLLALRGGFNIGSNKYRNAALGMGYSDKNCEVDYSFTYPFSGISGTYGSHQLSFIYRFGKEEERFEFTWKDLIELAETGFEPLKEGINAEKIAEAQELAIEGKKLIVRGYYGQGLDKLEKASDILKDDDEINQLRNKAVKIVKCVKKAAARSEKDSLVRKAVLAYIESNAAKSLTSLKDAVKKWPEDKGIKLLRKTILAEFSEENKKMAKQEKELAAQQLSKALEYIYNGKYEEAVTLCRQILKKNPGNVLALMRLGSAYYAQNRYDEAEEQWKQALKYDPENRQIHDFLKTLEKERKKKVKPEEKRKEISKETLQEYQNALKYYLRVKKYSSGTETLKNILNRMIEKFKDKGVNMDYVYEELDRLK